MALRVACTLFPALAVLAATFPVSKHYSDEVSTERHYEQNKPHCSPAFMIFLAFEIGTIFKRTSIKAKPLGRTRLVEHEIQDTNSKYQKVENTHMSTTFFAHIPVSLAQ